MLFRNEETKEGLVAVRGTYSVPPGPDWGWRILIGAESPDAMRILMYNVTPMAKRCSPWTPVTAVPPPPEPVIFPRAPFSVDTSSRGFHSIVITPLDHVVRVLARD